MNLSPQTQSKLTGLRSKVKLLFFVEGLSVALLVLCGAILVTLGLDYVLRGPALFRLVINLIVLGIIGYCAYRFLIYPLMVTMNEDDMALCVEKGYPGLKDSLISSLQLARRYDPSDTFNSSAMVRALMAQTEQVTARMGFGRVAGPSAGTKGFFAGALLAIAVVVVGFAAVPQMWDMFVDRIILLADVPYPEPWTLKVKGFDGKSMYIPSHYDVRLEIQGEHHSGEEGKELNALRIDYWVMENGRRRLRSKECIPDEREKNRFYIDIPRVKSDVEFIIKGFRVQDFKGKITVVPRPEILAIKCVVNPPRYTQRPTIWDVAVEDLNVLRGSEVDIRVKTSRPVSEANIVLTRGKESLKRVPLKPLPPEPGRPDDRNTRLRGTFFAEGTSTFKIVVQDEQFADDRRFTNLDPMEYTLTVHPDEVPSVLMVTPTSTNVKKVMNAIVRIRADAEDDNYIQRIVLLYQTFGSGAGTGEVTIGDRTYELYDVHKDRWTGGGEDPKVSYEPVLEIERPWGLDPLGLVKMGRVSMRLRVTDGFDLRHLPVAQDRLDRLAIGIYDGQTRLADFWERLNLPEDAKKRLLVMMHDGLIRDREKEIEQSADPARRAGLEDKRDAFRSRRNELQIEVLRDLIKRLDEEKRDTENVVDISEIAARIAKAYRDIIRLEVELGRMPAEELKDYEKKFQEAADAFKNRVEKRNIQSEAKDSWSLIDEVLVVKAADYLSYARAVNLEAPDLTADEAASLKELSDRFSNLAKPLREKRQEIYRMLKAGEEVDLQPYIVMVKELMLSGDGEFRDLRSREELEQRHLDAPPASEKEAFLLNARIYAKIEEEIARKLKHIDILQWRTSELRNQNFLDTWELLGMFDSLDFEALRVVVWSNRKSEETKRDGIEEKKATLSGEISELKIAIRKYCEKNNLSVEDYGFIPRPKEEAKEPPAEAGDAESGETSLHPYDTSFFTDVEGDVEAPEENGGEAEIRPEEEPEEDTGRIKSEAELLEARYLGWEKEQELLDLAGAEKRYEIFKGVEDALDKARRWVGPNFYETDLLQLNIVDKLDKQQDLINALKGLGKKIEAIKDIQSDDAIAALSRYIDLVKAARGYSEGGAESGERLIRLIKRIYPDEIDSLDKRFRNEDKTIDVDGLLQEIQKRKVRERATAWSSQKTIAETMPELVRTADAIREEFIDNRFEGHELVADLTRTMSDIEADDKGKGIIPTLLTLERVLAPDLTRLTDDIQQRSDDSDILLIINETILPRQIQVIKECEHMLKILQKVQDMGKVLERLRRIRTLLEAIRRNIELGGEEEEPLPQPKPKPKPKP